MEDLSNYFITFFEKIISKEKDLFSVNDKSIKNAIKTIHQVYRPNPSWPFTTKSNADEVDYNDPAFRCAYVYKYAACFTGMVYHSFKMAIEDSEEIFTSIKQKNTLNICSLGGGPGTDIIGVIAAICNNFSFKSFSISIIDAAEEWEYTFSLILDELKEESVKVWQSNPKYIHADLLSDWTNTHPVQKNVVNADLITMVKFISSAACCQQTELMISRIFENMKPGAMLFIIDNAAEGFDLMISNVAIRNGMTPLLKPECYYDYESSKFSTLDFGYERQYKTKIFFEVFQKSMTNTATIPTTSRQWTLNHQFSLTEMLCISIFFLAAFYILGALCKSKLLMFSGILLLIYFKRDFIFMNLII